MLTLRMRIRIHHYILQQTADLMHIIKLPNYWWIMVQMSMPKAQENKHLWMSLIMKKVLIIIHSFQDKNCYYHHGDEWWLNFHFNIYFLVRWYVAKELLNEKKSWWGWFKSIWWWSADNCLAWRRHQKLNNLWLNKILIFARNRQVFFSFLFWNISYLENCECYAMNEKLRNIINVNIRILIKI